MKDDTHRFGNGAADGETNELTKQKPNQQKDIQQAIKADAFRLFRAVTDILCLDGSCRRRERQQGKKLQ